MISESVAELQADPIFALLPDGGMWLQFTSVCVAAFGMAVLCTLVCAALGRK